MSDQEELENQVCVLIAEKVVLRDLVERAHHLALCVFKATTRADFERARHNAAVLANAIEHARQSAAQVPPPIASTAEGSAALDEVRAAAYTMLQFASEPDLAGCTTAFGYFMRRGQAVEFVRGILKKHRALSPKEPTDG